ncbi:MAG TPA: hypothetical protein VND98_06855 [Solirubrobacterales bacterium]|nr:hypothetical protein [Solirubrobacterales bacterium]
MSPAKSERVLVRTGPLLCPSCASEDVSDQNSAAEYELICENCGREFDQDSALICFGELRTEISGDSAALDCLAEFLYADPQTFPSGADTCEALDQALTKSGRGPASKHQAER